LWGSYWIQTAMNAKVQFTRMDQSTRADLQLLAREAIPFRRDLPNRVMAHLKLLEGDSGGFQVDRYTHSLQTATRALRDGRDDEYVVCALLHDIGDTIGCYNHPDIAAAILKPFVSEANLWMVQYHGIFQGHYFFHHLGMDRDMREQFRGHEHFGLTEEFCALYDNPAFDPAAETLPLSEFEPMLRKVMAEPRNTIYRFEIEDYA
jgi:predicted HD phosphohydrolase